MLVGSSGDDDLRGSDGDDVLNGGLGRDVLRGGEGADIFVWAAAEETARSVSQADIIFDFDATDQIDLTGFGDLTQVSRSSGGFTATGQAEVRISYERGQNYIRFDLDGDGARDIQIVLNTDLRRIDRLSLESDILLLA